MPWADIGLVVLGGLVGAVLTAFRQNWVSRKQHLRERRAQLYNELLVPYARALATAGSGDMDEGLLDFVQSEQYYEHRFNFVVEADDDVVREHNQMMRKIRAAEAGETEEDQTLVVMKAVADLLLRVRRGMGNKSTALNRVEVLEGIGIVDAGQHLRG